MLLSATTSRRMVPLPVPVSTVTVYGPEPLTFVIDAPVTPRVGSVKSVASTPETTSLKLTVKSTLVALVGFAPARTTLTTVGLVRSNVYTSPVKPPLSVLPAASKIELLLTRLRPIVPSPLPLLTLTVYGPLPVTPVIDAPLTPL